MFDAPIIHAFVCFNQFMSNEHVNKFESEVSKRKLNKIFINQVDSGMSLLGYSRARPAIRATITAVSRRTVSYCARQVEEDTCLGNTFLHEAARPIPARLTTNVRDWVRNEIDSHGRVLRLTRPVDQDVLDGLPVDGKKHPYIYGHLYTRGYDTVAGQRLASVLQLRRAEVFIAPGDNAGRGCTVRSVRLENSARVREKIARALREGRLNNGANVESEVNSRAVFLADILCAKEKLPDFSGIRHSIVLRGLSKTTQRHHIAESMENLSENGFLNFYGLQRFGRAEVRRYDIGSAILRGEYESALHLLLTANRDPSSKYYAACRAFQQDGVTAALHALPNEDIYLGGESSGGSGIRAGIRNVNSGSSGIQQVLYSKSKGMPARDIFLNKVDPNLIQRMVRSTAYAIWNHVVAWRISKNPRALIPGDLFVDAETGDIKVASTYHCDGTIPFDAVVLPVPGPNCELYPLGGMARAYHHAYSVFGLNETHFNGTHTTFKTDQPCQYVPPSEACQ